MHEKLAWDVQACTHRHCLDVWNTAEYMSGICQNGLLDHSGSRHVNSAIFQTSGQISHLCVLGLYFQLLTNLFYFLITTLSAYWAYHSPQSAADGISLCGAGHSSGLRVHFREIDLDGRVIFGRNDSAARRAKKPIQRYCKYRESRRYKISTPPGLD